MPLVGSFVLPHGALVLDEAKPVYSAELNRAMRQAAQDLVALQPDVVLLSTPHGIALDSDFGLYLNHAAKGSGKTHSRSPHHHMVSYW
jgi:aromatic ring-opening dioxygenase LigB subunit